MNNLRSIIIVVLTSVVFLIVTTKRVSAVNDIRFIFNNGFLPSTTVGCSDSELTLVDAVFVTRRVLRGSSNEHLSSANEKRNLPSSQYCSNICAGILPGTCRRTGCEGFRELNGSDKGDGRNLEACDSQITRMHEQLDAVSLQASDKCKLFLDRNKRQADCYPDAVYGQVEGMRVWENNSTTGSTGPLFMNHRSKTILPNQKVDICNSTKFNIESMNQPCVVNATFVVTGPNSYYYEHFEAISPFGLFGNSKTSFFENSFPTIGLYSISITPNSEPSKSKSFKLMVNHCGTRAFRVPQGGGGGGGGGY